VTWVFVDPKDGTTVVLPVTDSALVKRDFTWFGIRKGGDRWHTIEFFESPPFWRCTQYRPEPTSGQPLRAVGFEVPSTPGNWQPFGLTNDKKRLVIMSRDASASSPDQFNFFDVDGNLLAEVPCSDSPDRDNTRLVFLERYYYVVSDVGGSPRWRVKQYDELGNLLNAWVPMGVGDETVIGITTDGKAIYLMIGTGSTRIEKYSASGVLLRAYDPPGDGLAFSNGITFNGRYLIARLS